MGVCRNFVTVCVGQHLLRDAGGPQPSPMEEVTCGQVQPVGKCLQTGNCEQGVQVSALLRSPADWVRQQAASFGRWQEGSPQDNPEVTLGTAVPALGQRRCLIRKNREEI